MDSIRTLPIHVAPTTERKAERGRFENALRGAAQGLAQSAGLAAPFVPGGAILAGAIRGATSPQPSALGPTTGGSATVGARSDGLLATGGSYVDTLTAGTLDSEGLLRLQLEMQQENRAFTTVSNVMKVRHDTAKSAIQNIH
jgi:hypothetical protein